MFAVKLIQSEYGLQQHHSKTLDFDQQATQYSLLIVKML